MIYLTFDGLLQPIAQANVLPYVRALAETGQRIHVISLEREESNFQEEARRIAACLSEGGIGWQRLRYSTGGAASMFANMLRAFRAASKLSRAGGRHLIHARSYQAALIAWTITRYRRGGYIFDMRGYWIDEKRAVGRWFTRPATYAFAKRLERRLVRDASAVVTLTQLQADDLQPLRAQGDAIVTVPTCTDYQYWEAAGGAVPAPLRERLQSKLVIAFVGSHTNSYMLEESFRLFRFIRELRPDAYLLCVSREHAELRAASQSQQLPAGSWSLHSVPYSEMPGWLALARWGLILLEPGLAKRGSVPTKLAEFFAAGVRPIFYGCNEEVESIVRYAGSGVILPSTAPEAMRDAAAAIASAPNEPELIAEARNRTRAILDLSAGVAKYVGLYHRLGRVSRPVAPA